MQDKKHHDLLFNSKLHTINILNVCIIQLKSSDTNIKNRYICNIIYTLRLKEPFNLMLSSIQENYITINRFIDIWYYKIYKKQPLGGTFGIFGEINEENTNKRIEFLEQIIKQLNKPSKT